VASSITTQHLQLWEQYHSRLAPLEQEGKLRRPFIPNYCQHNAHMYYIIVRDLESRSHLINHLKSQGINSVFHYIPLHNSPAGKRYSRSYGQLHNTEKISEQLLRLPLFPDLSLDQVEAVVSSISQFFE